MSQNNQKFADQTNMHYLSIRSKKKIDHTVPDDFLKSFKEKLSSSHSMRQKPPIFDKELYKDFLKNEKIYIQMYYNGQKMGSVYEPYILAMGGQVSIRLSPKVTVVLTNGISKEKFRSLNQRILKTNKNLIPIVSILWLQAIYQQKKKVPKQQFLVKQEDIQGNQCQEVQQTIADYFQQEILQDLTANLHEQQDGKQSFFYFIDKKNKKQIIKKNNLDEKAIQIIQADSFVVTHNKIAQKVPKKKKEKKQPTREQIQKKVKRISQNRAQKKSQLEKNQQKLSRSQPLQQNQDKEIGPYKKEIIDQNIQNQNSNMRKQVEVPQVSLDFLLGQYFRVQNQEGKKQEQEYLSPRNAIERTYKQQELTTSTVSVRKGKQDKIKKQITQELQMMIQKELSELHYIRPQSDKFCINVLFKDQKILSHMKKMNQKYSKKGNPETFYFNFISQPQFADRVNRNQMFRMYMQLQNLDLIDFNQSQKRSKFKSDSQQQEFLVRIALHQIRQKLGYPKILYMCDKNCKLDCLYAQLSSLPKTHIVDFNIILAIADLNNSISKKNQSQNMDQAFELQKEYHDSNHLVYMQVAKLYNVKVKVNFQIINKKKLTILDSTILKNSLQYIVQKLGGVLVAPVIFVTGRQKCDIVITSKRSIKTFQSGRKKQETAWQVDAQTFISSLLTIQA